MTKSFRLQIGAVLAGAVLQSAVFQGAGAPTFGGWREVPGGGATLVADAAAVYRGKLYLFGIGIDHHHYVNVLDGSTWRGWAAIPGGGTTELPDAATVFQDKLYVFAIGMDDHRRYINVLEGEVWRGWTLMPGGATEHADAAVTFDNKLYVFAIGSGDHAHYLNTFDGARWTGWSVVPGGGTTLVADTATVYRNRLYLFGVGINDHAHYVDTFDGVRWLGWTAVPGGAQTMLSDAATTAGDKLYLFGIGVADHAHYVNVLDGARWTGWGLVPGGGTTDRAACGVSYLGDLYLFAIGGFDHHHYLNRLAYPRYNDVYQKSAHNTYAQDEDVFDVLFYHRIRSIEFDLTAWHTGYGSAAAGDWWVAHSSAEFGSSVRSLANVLDYLAVVNRALPDHEVVTVWMDHDIEDGDPDHNSASFDRTLRARLGSELFTPADLLSDCQSDWRGLPDVSPPTDLPQLHAGIAAGYCRWPTLDSLRGRFIFVITSGANGYVHDVGTRAAFLAGGDVVTNPNIFFGNFGNSDSAFADADWNRGPEVDAAHFVSRIYYNCVPIPCGVDSPDVWNRAVTSRFHHLATNHVNDDEAPWNRTHNVRGYPFCPLGAQPCDQQFATQVEGGATAGGLYAMTVRSGDLEVGISTTDNFGFVADSQRAPPAFALTGFVAAASSHVPDWAKGCLMVRGSLDNTAPYYAICRAADNHGPFVQYRALGCSGPCGTASIDSPFGEDAVFLRLEAIRQGPTTTVSGFVSIDDLNWRQIGDPITFPASLDLSGFAVSSHGNQPVKFLFGAMKLGALGGALSVYVPIPATLQIGDATSVVFEDIARAR